MGFKNFFNPKWKHPHFIRKAKHVVLTLSLLALLFCENTQRKIDRLSAECELGNEKACVKLAEIAKNDKELDFRLIAVNRLKDQAIIAEIAMNDRSDSMRWAAVKKLTDQTSLAEIAKNTKDSFMREAAVERIIDLPLLAEIAKNAEDFEVGWTAVKRLKDKTLLAEIARNAKDFDVRRQAASKISFTVTEINNLNDSDPLLMQLTGDIESFTYDSKECLARLKIATQEPIIKSLCPGLHCIAHTLILSKRYFEEQYPYREVIIDGENHTFKLIQTSKTLVYKSWSADFPIRTQNPYTIDTNVSGIELLKDLFSQLIFTKEDLVKLSQSIIPEIRAAAVDKLSAQSLIAEIAKIDKCRDVRIVAVKKLTDQTLLTYIAKNDEDSKVRETAVNKLTNQATLAEIAKNDKDFVMREAAESRLKKLKKKLTIVHTS